MSTTDSCHMIRSGSKNSPLFYGPCVPHRQHPIRRHPSSSCMAQKPCFPRSYDIRAHEYRSTPRRIKRSCEATMWTYSRNIEKELPSEQPATNRPFADTPRSASEHARFRSAITSSVGFKTKQGATSSHPSGKDHTRSRKSCGQVHSRLQTAMAMNFTPWSSSPLPKFN